MQMNLFRKLNAFVYSIIYLLLFLVAFEGARRAPLVLLFAFIKGTGATFGFSRVTYGVEASLIIAALALLSAVLFTSIYLAQPFSRSAAVLGISIGMHVWGIAIAINVVGLIVWECFHVREIAGQLELDQVIVGIILLFAIARAYVLAMPDVPHPAVQIPITASTQPRLWKILEECASRCGARLPGKVFWLPAPNAQVEQIGRFGFGKKRALGIGFPILRLLSTDEFIAVIAHELHHLRADDPFLSNCIYSSRRHTHELVSTLTVRWFTDSLLLWFLGCYSAIHWHLSKPIVRQWEFDADSFAGGVTSPGSMARALVALDLAQARYKAFQASWIQPAISAGFLPPVINGFWEYYEGCAREEQNYIRHMAGRAVDREGDTHPPVRDRLFQLSHLGDLTCSGGSNSAFELLTDQTLLRPSSTSRIIP